ncbi:unnamed protein product [Adineta steineri]|uniref:Uncharacterized protein n=1 Tax=Adineta steineri TaxID=433720 RepID=A0A819X782_9BILA|nr:unnamed protein product [Adineta steineri]
MMLKIFLLLGLIDYISTRDCYVCTESGYNCSLPLNFDSGDESRENDIAIASYPSNYVCMRDHSYNPNTQEHKIMLRGIANCQDVNEPNHLVYCCNTDNCNRYGPQINIRSSADLTTTESERKLTIHCYMCTESGYNCSLPLYFDGGDESNEAPIVTATYPSNYACMRDDSYDPSTQKHKIILRGVEDCEDVNELNHHVYCCYTDNCNKDAPQITFGISVDLTTIEYERESTIQCYTCTESGFYCSFPLYFDDGDDSSENDIVTSSYPPNYVCMRDHSYDPSTQKHKIILRGIEDCEDVDEPNHRVYCCYADNCNRYTAQITIRIPANRTTIESERESSSQNHISSIMLIGLIDYMPAIRCYTCIAPGFSCSLPLNFDGDESMESDIDTSNYDSGYACMNDHSYDPITQKHKIILRGIEDCQPLDVPNHLAYCCYTDNCNRYGPQITIRSSGDLMSSSQIHISSTILIGITISFQYFLLK